MEWGYSPSLKVAPSILHAYDRHYPSGQAWLSVLLVVYEAEKCFHSCTSTTVDMFPITGSDPYHGFSQAKSVVMSLSLQPRVKTRIKLEIRHSANCIPMEINHFLSSESILQWSWRKWKKRLSNCSFTKYFRFTVSLKDCLHKLTLVDQNIS